MNSTPDKSRNLLILMATTIVFFVLLAEVLLITLTYSEQKKQMSELQKQWQTQSPLEKEGEFLTDQDIQSRMSRFAQKVFPVSFLITFLLLTGITGIFYFIMNHYINPKTVIDKSESFLESPDFIDGSQNSGTQLIHAAKLSGIGEFASTIVHDLKNPLTMIFANLDILLLKHKKKVLKIEDAMEHIERIRFSAKRIKRLVDHMNRISRDDFDLSKFISIKEVFKNSLIILESKIKSNEVEIRDRIEENLEKIQGDANSLEQVLMNLIANSIDAMEFSESKWIEISAQSDETQVRIILKDSGPGVPEHLRDKVFSPFFTSKEEGKGTGLGLSICQKIIDAHKGTIELNSPDEGGAEFIITLPKTHTVEYQQEIAS